nr:MAG TPA: hypothetical protein [Caudoviricetes sp.]
MLLWKDTTDIINRSPDTNFQLQQQKTEKLWELLL